jgi:hypothetical protein
MLNHPINRIARVLLVLTAALLLRDAEPERPASQTLPQFPPAEVCQQHSWEAWYWYEYFRELCDRGCGNQDTGLLARGNYRDSYLWWDLAILQSPAFADADREAAQDRILAGIGAEAFQAGLMPPVVRYPFARPNR